MAHPFAAANANANAQVCILIQLQTTTDQSKGTQKRPNTVSRMTNMKLLISFFLFGILTAYFYQESVDMTGIVKAYFYKGSVDTTADIPPEDCVDKDSECTKWTSLGECIDNEIFMLKTCCKSCAGVGVVSETTDDTTTPEDEDDCVNKDKQCPQWASIGECEANESFMLKTCCKSCLGSLSKE